MNTSLQLYLKLTRILTARNRMFSGGLDGMGFSEFMLLYYLNTAPGQLMRRVDLADRLGLTASGVTRLLAPMEKIGLVTREAAPRDARVSLVGITEAGNRNLRESMDRAEEMAEQVFPPEVAERIFSEIQNQAVSWGG